ncbi:hypothetical protein DB42_AZ00140 [Neochlamydia sp. EPS4]|uniref:tetratricopeptide repeat protein n=1 Tax=Neochlamydia sp. EPS4 TaxID=1478175 RepID=UPI000583B72C|nr:tetratricopeptide repeat protein [Neochlamydia sp. EPS4]KIC74659.1 hypothetical protein DB42_AZ00140 [Neochlamydia sp. EPS4]
MFINDSDISNNYSPPLVKGQEVKKHEISFELSSLLEKIEWCSNKRFVELADENSKKNLDYILAAVVDENNQTTFYDGCQFTRFIQEVDGIYSPSTQAKIKDIYYYFLNPNKQELQPLFTKKDLESPLYWNYLFANDSLLEESARAECLFQLGNCYYQGSGVEVNMKYALEYYRRAINLANHAKAVLMLAYCYENGEGIEKNEESARHWYSQAVSHSSDPVLKQLASQKLTYIEKEV